MNVVPTASRRRPSTGGRSTSGDETRTKILDAALATLMAEGFLGTTARSIARTGEFNQALVFYHFGSVDDVLLAAVERRGTERIAQYADRVEAADDLGDLVAVCKDLLRQDIEDGYITILAQMLAGAHARPELGPRLLEAFEPWLAIVEAAVRRAVSRTPFADAIPARQMAHTLTGMFVGIELLHQLDPDVDIAESLFTSIDLVAAAITMVFPAGQG